MSQEKCFDSIRIPKGFWYNAYDAVTPLIEMGARLAGSRNGKVKRALAGRGEGMTGWRIGTLDERPGVLLHAASYGEYEAIRPLIERLTDLNVRTAVSFSSPSAEKTVRETSGLWASGFLPLDRVYRQLELLGRLDPSVVLITKHDYWPNLIRAAAALKIPVGLINANFHSKSRRSAPIIGSFHRSFMKSLDFVWTVSEMDSKRVEPLLSPQTELKAAGDSRFDRVRQRALQGRKRFRRLKDALGNDRVLMAGSSWEQGERIIWEAFGRLRDKYPDLKLIVAPHEPTEDSLSRNKKLGNALGCRVMLYSEWDGGKIEAPVVLVDMMGVLAGLYALGWATYVGGGFGRGVHSVIEPAAHGLPVMFGPHHHVSHEAELLLQAGGGYEVRSTEDVLRLLGQWLSDNQAYLDAAGAADGVVKAHEGVTDTVIERIEPYLSLKK